METARPRSSSAIASRRGSSLATPLLYLLVSLLLGTGTASLAEHLNQVPPHAVTR